jgi:hypothetical protein
LPGRAFAGLAVIGTNTVHLTLHQQRCIDLPRGIQQAVELLAARRGRLHAAHDEDMECLGVTIWMS